MRNRINTSILAVIIALSTLVGCGQKGPLYLPEQPSENQQPKEESEPATTES